MGVKFTVRTEEAKKLLARLQRSLTPGQIDHAVDTAAFRIHSEIVPRTPKRWFGSVRAGWTVQKPQEGSRRIINTNKVMGFLEHGTANGGTGFIRPKVKKALYIPLTRRAAGGWHAGLRRGQDYILRVKVRGIKPRNIVSDFMPRARTIWLEEMRAHIRASVRRGRSNG